jgi:hypothetical protein
MITVRNVQAGQDRWTYFQNSTKMQSTDVEKPQRDQQDRFRNSYLEAGSPSQWPRSRPCSTRPNRSRRCGRSATGT